MRVGFYDPYLSILGGGEKYLLTMLETAVRDGHEVTLMSPAPTDAASWRRLGVEVAPDEFRWKAVNQLSVTPATHGLDLFVALHNFLPPVSFAARSVAVIQFPFRAVGSGRPLRRLGEVVRVRSYDTWVVYSRFVERHMRERLRVEDAVVIAPPVDVEVDVPVGKARSVVAVGRFFPAEDQNNKKHGVMIDAWRRLAADGWTLHLAGGAHADPGTEAYVAGLRAQASGVAVEFHPNASPDRLEALYGDAALFWHAAGHGETRPERQEHFGITTVEAMAHGCVPVVAAVGGQPEIVTDGVDGYLWGSVDELVERTRSLIGDPARAEALRAAAVRSARRFAKDEFVRRVRADVLRTS